MTTRPQKPRSANTGFTLIELMVTLAIGAALAMAAIPALRSYVRNAEVVSVSNTLVSAINAARGEAMKRGMNAMIVPADGSRWTSGWNIFVDRDRDFAYGTTDHAVYVQMPPAPLLVVSGSGTAGGPSPYLLFDGSGYSRTKAGGFAAVSLTIERKDEPTTLDYTRLVKIAQTGRPRVCKPASSSDSNCSVSLED